MNTSISNHFLPYSFGQKVPCNKAKREAPEEEKKVIPLTYNAFPYAYNAYPFAYNYGMHPYTYPLVQRPVEYKALEPKVTHRTC